MLSYKKYLNAFRVFFGIYLTYHFFELIPYAEELFGNHGLINDPTLSPTYNIFPNLLLYINSVVFIKILTIIAAIFTFGFCQQICSLILWYGWACLLNRNVFISNPGMAFVGWILLAMSLIKTSKSYNSYRINHNNFKKIYFSAWFLMGIGYTMSGLHKLQCPSWIDGTALYHILNSPLARDNFVRNFLVMYPLFLKICTWGSLILEIIFLPLGMFYHTRLIFWITYIIFHLGIMTVINFTDLTIGVLMIHLLTFDVNWIKNIY